uniref:Uncharacterized protein n=1 Tax=Romanomermis culicivorax TaxID=13658 RepID=A0A915K108_ROMCU
MKENPCCLSRGNKMYLDYIISQITAFDITLIKRNLNTNEAKGRRTVYDNLDDVSSPPSPYAFEEIANKFIDNPNTNDITRDANLIENKNEFLEKMVNICKELLIKGYEQSNTAMYILSKMQEIKDACEKNHNCLLRYLFTV